MQKKKYGLFRIFAIALLLLGGAAAVYEYKTKEHPFALHLGHQDTDVAIKNWISYSPKDAFFAIKFPSRPDYSSRELPIPRSEDKLPYHEYVAKHHHVTASVSYTVLPDNWLKWGSGMVLKGALKVIMNDAKDARLIGSDSNSIKSYPALDFQHKKQGHETAGTLILVGNTLYKVEITYPEHEKRDVQDMIAPFIDSFTPSPRSH